MVSICEGYTVHIRNNWLQTIEESVPRLTGLVVAEWREPIESKEKSRRIDTIKTYINS